MTGLKNYYRIKNRLREYNQGQFKVKLQNLTLLRLFEHYSTLVSITDKSVETGKEAVKARELPGEDVVK